MLPTCLQSIGLFLSTPNSSAIVFLDLTIEVKTFSPFSRTRSEAPTCPMPEKLREDKNWIKPSNGAAERKRTAS